MSNEINKEIRKIKRMLVWLVLANLFVSLNSLASSYRESERMEEHAIERREDLKALRDQHELDAYLKCRIGPVCEVIFPDAAKRIRNAQEPSKEEGS